MRPYGFLLLSFGSVLASQQPFNLQAAFEKTSNSVVVVHVINLKGEEIGLGSGVVIAPGEVVTNAHVARAGTGAFLSKGSKQWTVTGIFLDPKLDLALLKTEPIPLPPVKLGEVSGLKPGQKLFAIGNPNGLELSLSDGILSAVRHLEGATYIQTTAPISPGSSGGGVFNTKSELVGITTFMVKDGQNLNFAITSNYIRELRVDNIELKQSKANKVITSEITHITLSDFQKMSNDQLLGYSKINNPIASEQLGYRLIAGQDKINGNWIDTTKDIHRGTYWLTKAALIGNNSASLSLANDYLEAIYHDKNILEAKRFALQVINNIDSNYDVITGSVFTKKKIKSDLTRTSKILCQIYIEFGSQGGGLKTDMEAMVYAEILATLIQESLGSKKELTPEEIKLLGGFGKLVAEGSAKNKRWIDLRDKLRGLYGEIHGIAFLETAQTRAKALMAGYGILD